MENFGKPRVLLALLHELHVDGMRQDHGVHGSVGIVFTNRLVQNAAEFRVAMTLGT